MRYLTATFAILLLLTAAPSARAQTITMPPLAMQIAQTGIVSIPLTSFPGVDSSYLRVLRNGSEIPAQIAGGAIQFVATANESRASTVSSYWITADGTFGLRGILETTIPLHWERDALYQSVAASERGDRWFAGEIRVAGESLPIRLSLPAAAVPAETPFVISLASLVPTEHRLRLSYNGEVISVARWNERVAGPQNHTLYLAHGLPAGEATLSLALTSTASPDDMLLIDAVTLPEVRVSLPALPTPTLTPVDLHNSFNGPDTTATGANILLITPALFVDSLRPLLQMHAQRGESVAAVDVQHIYDEFSYGVRDPEAIRSYIRVAVQHWKPAPRVVLLFGAGSVRMRVDTQTDDATLIPPYLVTVDPKYGEVACDTCYARVSGTGLAEEQSVPDLPIGRFPIHTIAEANALVAKTVRAMIAPAAGSWRARAVTLADNTYEANGTPDPAGDFVAAANLIPVQLPGYSHEQYLFAPNQSEAKSPYYQSPEALRTQFLRSFDAGAALVAYVGHASLWQWAYTTPDAPTPFLFGLYDADARTNTNRLPILLSLTCLSGNWANPTLQTVDERLLLHPHGGVVAALSPTGSGVNTAHTLLAEGVVPALAGRQSLGAAHLAGLRLVAARAPHDDLLYTYGILGHPDVILPPVVTPIFLPLANS